MFNDDRIQDVRARIINNDDGSYNARLYTKDGLQLLNVHQVSSGGSELLDSNDKPISGGGSANTDLEKTIYKYIDKNTGTEEAYIFIDMFFCRITNSTTAGNFIDFAIGYDGKKFIEDYSRYSIYSKYFEQYRGQEMPSGDANAILDTIFEELKENIKRYVLFVKRIGDVDFQITTSQSTTNYKYLFDDVSLELKEEGYFKVSGKVYVLRHLNSSTTNSRSGTVSYIPIDAQLPSEKAVYYEQTTISTIETFYCDSFEDYLKDNFNITITGSDPEE